MRHALQSIYQSVFFPESFAENSRALLCVLRFGWIFILTRWLYYSILFIFFRDYHGAWRPFAGLPFGVDLRTYAALQRELAVPFGVFVMAVMSVALRWFLGLVGKRVSHATIFNILGVTFFLPFILLQPIDLFLIRTGRWQMPIVAPIHTAALIWESVAAVRVLSVLTPMKRWQEAVAAVLLIGVWILLCGLFWR